MVQMYVLMINIIPFIMPNFVPFLTVFCCMFIFFKFFLNFIKKNFVIIIGLFNFGNRLHYLIDLKCQNEYKISSRAPPRFF